MTTHQQALFSGFRTASTALASSNNPFNTNFGNNDDNADDDGDMIDLSRQDWRAFRAHLVQAEHGNAYDLQPASRRRTSNDEHGAFEVDLPEDDGCVPETGDCDLDGIGRVFGVRTNSAAAALSGIGASQVPAPHLRLPQPQTTMQPGGWSSSSSAAPMEPEPWAYDSGRLIETGAVLLGGVEQEFGFGLRQQYFHKAAILVLDHCEATFTKGIILNRPTDLYLEDDLNPGAKWRVWFGGDVQGLESSQPDLVCLHSLDDPQARHASISVMNDLQWTTFDNAKRLVRAGVAEPDDFWVFCGYAGWGAGQLLAELDRNSWYSVATDSNTLLKELARQGHGRGADPREAGLGTWNLLMDMMGRGHFVSESVAFDDLMLKEWAHRHLLSAESGGGAGQQRRDPDSASMTLSSPSTQELLRKDPVDRLLDRAQAASRGDEVRPGTLVRAANRDRSPFLLHDQELHKSVVLVLSDDDQITVGAILNRPAAKGLDIRIEGGGGGASRRVTLPLRFGGQYSVKEGEPLVWLHCHSLLRAAGVGQPLAPASHPRKGHGGIWKCTAADVTAAIGQGLATPQDFFVVTGVTVWTKGEGGTARGMQGEIRSGRFEVVPEPQVEAVWDALAQQRVLTPSNLRRNLDLAEDAWREGGSAPHRDRGWSHAVGDSVDARANQPHHPHGYHPHGSGDVDEDDAMVYESHVTVSQLSDDALRSWVSIFLLGSSASNAAAGP